MDIKISCDEAGEKFLCELFAQMLEDRWAAEDAEANKPMEGKKVVYIPHSMCREGIVIF